MKKLSVECRDIRLAYGKTEVLKQINLQIEPGEFFALLGPSGSGKSTLLRLIAGFSRQQHGEVLIDGVDIGRKPPWQRNVGMVFQSYALWPHLSVWDNVAFGLVERKTDRATLKAKVGAVLELVGLQAYAKRRPNQLSGGQQQRVALARTIVIEPQVLLLDEPLSNLDRSLRVQMREELLALQRRLGLTTIFVTHDQEEAMCTADRMAVLNHGVLQQVGPPAALYDAPVNPFVAGFVGTMNLLAGTLRSHNGAGAVLDVDGFGALQIAQDASAATSGTVQLGARPHTLRMEPPGAMLDPHAAWADGRIEASEFQGGFTRYRVAVGPQHLSVDLPHRTGTPAFATGAPVCIGIDPSQVRVFSAALASA